MRRLERAVYSIDQSEQGAFDMQTLPPEITIMNNDNTSRDVNC